MINSQYLTANTNKPLLVLAVTSHVTMCFFRGQIDFLKKAGFDIAVVCSPGWANIEGVKYYPIVMEREISIVKDLRSLYLLTKLFFKIKPCIINAGTPKAALLVGLAAFISNVPIRIYTCHGLRLETLRGWKRKLLTVTEKITTFSVHRVVCVSNSLCHKFIKMDFVAKQKVTVIGAGSCNGIDLNEFNQIKEDYLGDRNILKGKKICNNAIFIGFIGRITKDKGIYELIEAFDILKEKFPNLYLLLLGGFENGDPISEGARQKIIQDERIINLGWISDTKPYYKLMKIVVLPTYREGLPTVLLEAGAMGIPVVASSATGCVDVVVDGETGVLVPIGNSTALANGIEMLLNDETLALTMGRKARQRMEQFYKQEIVWHNVVGFYKDMLMTAKVGCRYGMENSFLK